MRIVYHLGVHCTDEERLLRCLLKNRAALSEEGIVVPGPNRYRNLLRDTAMQLKGQPANRDTQALLLEQIMDEDRAKRLILSWDHFMGYAATAVGDRFYPAGPERMAAFTQIFPDIETEFHIALRNPATFLPAMRTKVVERSPEAGAAADPALLRWSDLLAALRARLPDIPITVWCDEDTPLLWPEVLAAVSGHGPDLALADTGDLLAAIMLPEGMDRMQRYMTDKPPGDTDARRRIVTAFLGKFARPDAIEMELDMPGWSPDLVQRLTDGYMQDMARIMAMQGVTVLAP